MDAASLALSVVALYSTCRDCYIFFTTVKKAEKDTLIHLRELDIQQSILKAWGFYWEIQRHPDSGNQHFTQSQREQTKLHRFLLNNRFKAEGVYHTLSALADTLSDRDKLIKRYGLRLQPVHTDDHALQDSDEIKLAISETNIRDIEPVLKEVRRRLSVLNKCRWALKDRDNFKKLIIDLRAYSDALYRLCPEGAFESLNIFLTMECLAKQESPAGLKWTSRLALQQAQADDESATREGYELLASAAALKARINEHQRNDGVAIEALVDGSKEQDIQLLGKGLALFQGQVVYTEMRDYRVQHRSSQSTSTNHVVTTDEVDPLRQPRIRGRIWYSDHLHNHSNLSEDGRDDSTSIEPFDTRARALIMNFFRTFKGANMSKNNYGLDIVGMVDHTQGENKGRCSILYKLPGSMGVPSRSRPAENLILRAPVTLRSMFESGNFKGRHSSLGKRFELARNLVRAVCLLHSSGWLHKNIRAESVIFFPEQIRSEPHARYEEYIEIDVSKPILMGYIFSRPDDIKVESTSALPPGPSNKAAPEEPSTYAGRYFASTTHSGIKLDYYQHPVKHAHPQCLYRHAYDVYSLGILLIEVGLWDTLPNIRARAYADNYHAPQDDDTEDHYARRRRICRECLPRLRWYCGDKYADVVLNCLMIDSGDDEVAQAGQRELCARIIADLEGCQA